MSAPPVILDLVQRFERNRETYHSGKHFATAKTDFEHTALRRQIDATGNQIDNLVYELYRLTKAEINIVESIGVEK